MKSFIHWATEAGLVTDARALKVPKAEREEFLRGVLGEGYCTVIAHGVDEARAVLEWYIGITENEPPSVNKTELICQAHLRSAASS